jgi:hypothetical protein
VERDHANLGEEDESLTRWLGHVDVPSSIRAHWLGQKKAARALCEARLVEYLAEAGLDEEGETAAAWYGESWAPSPGSGRQRNQMVRHIEGARLTKWTERVEASK